MRGLPTLKADIGGGVFIPVESLGGGAIRLLTIFTNMYQAEGGLLILDEIENGLHHSIMTDIWAKIIELAEELNVQIFATTHSEDCMKGAAAAARMVNRGDWLAVHRLYLSPEGRRIETYSVDKLESALGLGLDVR